VLVCIYDEKSRVFEIEKRESYIMNLSPRKKLFVDTATEMFGVGAIITNAQVKEASIKADVPKAGWFKKSCKIGYNQFKLPSEETPVVVTTTEASSENVVMNLVATNMEKQNLVPSVFEKHLL